MINIIVADHEPIFRAGIARLLAAEDDFCITAQPRSAVQLLNALAKLRSHVVILSTTFLYLLAEIQEVAIRHPFAVLLLAEDSERAGDFMQRGLQGVIHRSASGKTLVEAVRRLSRGELFFETPNPEQVGIRDDLVGLRVRDRLTEREMRIVAAVAQGHKNREIALRLHTSEQMIKKALQAIFDKIGVSDRLELALFVIHHDVLAKEMASPFRDRSTNAPNE